MSLKEDTEAMTSIGTTADNDETNAAIPSSTESAQVNSTLEDEISDYVAKSTATFKSQQKDEPELSHTDKKKIAFDQLRNNRSTFLAKFGKHMKKEHLTYFEDEKEDYEVRYHVNRLKRYFDNNTRKIDVKNRRYQALKILVEKGEYFSETEMMKRNPLLYENLIGRYLTEEEKKKRDNIDTTNITFVNLLLESIERDRLRNKRQEQQDAEDEVAEENDSDDDSDAEEKNSQDDKEKYRWGEMTGPDDPHEGQKKEQRLERLLDDISSMDRRLFREEFVTQMYESFLDGKDSEFDYSTVDDNEGYDYAEIRNNDEEDKYFDSESPETVLVENVRDENDSEDELDIYMKSLKVN